MISIIDSIDFLKGLHPKAGRIAALVVLALVIGVAPVRSWFLAHEEACYRNAMQPAVDAYTTMVNRSIVPAARPR